MLMNVVTNPVDIVPGVKNHEMEFKAPVVLVLEQGNYKVTHGCAKIVNGTMAGPGKCGSVTFEGLTDSEVDDCHESGWKVYEYTGLFIGYWRDLYEF